MSAVSAAASAALPSSGFTFHAHRRGSPVSPSASTDALTSTDSSADSAAPATTQGLFSSLLQTAEKIVGVQLTAPPAAALPSAAAPTAPSSTLSSSVGTVDPKLQSLLKQIQAQAPTGTRGPSLGLAQALAKLQLLTSPTQAAAPVAAGGGRIDITA